MIRLIADVFKALSKVVYGLSGQFLAKNKRSGADKLQFALDLVTGRAVLLRPTVPQAAAITGVPEAALKSALTQQGLRTPRAKPRLPRLAPGAPTLEGWDARFTALVDEVGTLPILEKLAAREAASFPNGTTAAGAAAVDGSAPSGVGATSHS